MILETELCSFNLEGGVRSHKRIFVLNKMDLRKVDIAEPHSFKPTVQPSNDKMCQEMCR